MKVSEILYNNTNHNNININLMAMFMMLSPQKVTAVVDSVHLMNLEQHQAAVDPQTKPADGLQVRLQAADTHH